MVATKRVPRKFPKLDTLDKFKKFVGVKKLYLDRLTKIQVADSPDRRNCTAEIVAVMTDEETGMVALRFGSDDRERFYFIIRKFQGSPWYSFRPKIFEVCPLPSRRFEKLYIHFCKK